MRKRSPARLPETRLDIRMRLRGFLAVLAVLVNATLPAGWELAFADTGPFGDTYAICLAGGGVIHDSQRPDSAPVSPAGSLHCHLCLLPGPPISVAQDAVSTPVPAPAAGRVRYHASNAGLLFDGTANAFEARAPPA